MNYEEFKNYCVWDVEVVRGPDETPGGWNNPAGMGLASAVVWDYATSRYHFFLHPERMEDLKNFLSRKMVCVGFNSIQFDSRVLQGNYRSAEYLEKSVYLTCGGGVRLRHLDLLVEYLKPAYQLPSHWDYIQDCLSRPEIHTGDFTLDGLAEGTLNQRKSGSGEFAPKLYQAARYDDLLEYNLQDVRLTKQLFEYMLGYKHLITRSGKCVRVDL